MSYVVSYTQLGNYLTLITPHLYKNLMEEYKSKFPLAEIELHQLQQKIEDDTMKFDECAIYNEVPNFLK